MILAESRERKAAERHGAQSKEVAEMYCRHCGEQIDDKAVICPKCGVPVNEAFFASIGQAGQNGQAGQSGQNEKDSPSAGFTILSLLFPVVGLILWLVWKDTMPKRSKSCGTGALAAVVAVVAVIVLNFMFLTLAYGGVLISCR